MKKTILLVCAAMMLVLCFSATVTLAKGLRDQCIELCTTTADNESGCSIVWLDSEGWFDVVRGDRYGQQGEYAWYGAAFNMQFNDQCGSFFAGTVKRGFFTCTGLNDRIITPGFLEPLEGYDTYFIKNIDKRNCEEIMKESSSSE
jgi:hypothetical protein